MDLKSIIAKALNYHQYRLMIKELIKMGMTTGLDQSDKKVSFTLLNEYRMDRLEKRVLINSDFYHWLEQNTKKEIWLMISEAWCGDSAQNVPVFQKIAEASGGNISFFLTGRDENPELMEAFLTNGAQSIPKLIRINPENFEVIGTWGPRPLPAHALMLEWKATNGAMPKDEFEKNLHLWYARNNGVTVQEEMYKSLSSN